MGMKRRQYPNLEAAIAYLKSVGKLDYGGHAGEKMVYSLEIPGELYKILFVHPDGLVELYREMYKSW